MRRRICSSVLLMLLLSVFVSFSAAQEQLKDLKPENYGQWQYLRTSVISDDGNWVSYYIRLVKGCDTLYVKNTGMEKEYKYADASSQQFSRDSRWIAFRIGYPEDKIEQMRKNKKPVHNKMGLLNLKSGDYTVFSDVSSFRFSRSGGHILMRKYKPKGKKGKGYDLVLKNLKTGAVRTIGNVNEYGLNKAGDFLAYTIDAKDMMANGVELLDLRTNTVHVLDSDSAVFAKLSWEKEGDALAFLRSYGDTLHAGENQVVVAYRNVYKGLKKEQYNPAKDADFPADMRIADEYAPFWAEDLSRLFFGIKEWKEKGHKDKGKKKKKEKLAGVEIWHWKDTEIIPRQKKTYGRDKNFSFRCVWNFGKTGMIRLANEKMRDVRITGDQKYAVGSDRTPYEPAFQLTYADYYLINTETGKKYPLLKKGRMFYGSSPDGKYLMYFKDNNWYSYSIKNGKHVCLTDGIDTDFWNTRDDRPTPKNEKAPWGYGGWLKGDKGVFLYDQFNIWLFKPDGSKHEKLTGGADEDTIFRITRLDYEKDYFEPKEMLYLSAFGDLSKKSGYYRMKTGSKPEKLIYEDMRISSLRKARQADKFMFVKQSFEQSPNVFVAGKSFTGAQRFSDTNPQQAEYKWGRAELVEYTNDDGVKLQGVLHYPAGWEEGKKYPMLVYIYERRSDGLHYYDVPTNRRAYDLNSYITNGYFLFQPDIIYKNNQPGNSAVKCVVPAVKSIIAKGLVDEKRIGLTGHSWGAYQTCFIVTRTDIFAAAVAGAPLTNMISMYNEIYWNTGSTNAVIFETSQGRFPQPYWENMEVFIDNSPIFHAKDLHTPLMVAFGDNDGAVDWHQGIEFYNTLRRMQKEYIMLVYAGENHGLRKKENQIDYWKRTTHFFNHYLKGDKADKWLTEGQTYLEKKEIEAKNKKK